MVEATPNPHEPEIPYVPPKRPMMPGRVPWRPEKGKPKEGFDVEVPKETPDIRDPDDDDDKRDKERRQPPMPN